MATVLKALRATKYSGVQWLGDVPEHWAVLPGRACFVEKAREPNLGLRETTVLSLSYGRIVVKPPEKLHGLVPASFETYQIVDPLDIVVRPTDLQNDWNSLRFGLSRFRGIITSAYMCLQTNGRLARQYGFLLLHTYDLMKIFYGLGSGLRQNLGWSDFRYLPCCVPPLPEQTAIVRFLDHADRRIRRYIRAKEKLIELLEEQKQAIIHQAVTGQIDVRTGQPYPAYKDSGVEWLRVVPEHWEVCRSKRLFRPRKERARTSDIQLAATQAYGVIAQDDYEARVGRRVVKIFRHLDRRRHVEVDDFVISMRSFQGGLERAWISGCIRSSYVVLRPTGASDVGYFSYLFKSTDYITALQSTANFIRDGQDLNFDNFRRVDLPLPPIEEQRRIAAVLDRVTADVGSSLAERLRRQVELMQEYRTRLVADVVTGKLNVRESAASLPETGPLTTDDPRHNPATPVTTQGDIPNPAHSPPHP